MKQSTSTRVTGQTPVVPAASVVASGVDEEANTEPGQDDEEDDCVLCLEISRWAPNFWLNDADSGCQIWFHAVLPNE